ncbi:unnamed protein product, partial [Scytosiphon promiscuus]
VVVVVEAVLGGGEVEVTDVVIGRRWGKSKCDDIVVVGAAAFCLRADSAEVVVVGEAVVGGVEVGVIGGAVHASTRASCRNLRSGVSRVALRGSCIIVSEVVYRM